MPALPPVPGVIKVRLIGTQDASIPWGSRFFVEYTGGPPSATDLDSLATNVATDFHSNLMPYATDDKILTQVICEDLSSSSGAVGEVTVSDAGSSGGTPLAASTALVINHQINRRYRGGKPKIFLPLGDTAVRSQNNEWTSALVSSVTAAWNTFVTAVLAGSYSSFTLLTFVNISYYEGFTVVTSPTTHRARNVPTLRITPVIDTIVSNSVAQKLGSVRRRNNT